jgi:hypothetical protein
LNKNKMIKSYIYAGLALMLPFIGAAQNQNNDASDLQLNTITTAVPFLQITPDSRSGAMGDAGTALSPTSSSFFWNTSMLSFAEDNSEISLSYSPWLQNLATDINLSHLSGFIRLNDRNVVGGSLRYFSLGEIVFTDNNGQETMTFTPSEFEVLGGYAFKLNEKFSLGLNGKFIFSNLTGGINVAGASTRAGLAGAADVSFSYLNEDVRYFGTKGSFAFGATVNNIGNKVTYTLENDRDFLPTNLKLGTAMTFDLDTYNSITWAFDVSKLLVPTPPRYSPNTGEIIAGLDPNIGVVPGILQSFYDAPGTLSTDENGEVIVDEFGQAQIEDGSRLGEELREIMIGTGLEYWYNDLFAARMGYFYENITKGARQHLTFGIGLKYKMFGIDFSYLTSVRQNNPLQNTIRFTMRFYLGNRAVSGDGSLKP